MMKYIKVTLKEFQSMISEIESGLAQSGGWDDNGSRACVYKAAKAVKAIEKRNKIKPSPWLNLTL